MVMKYLLDSSVIIDILRNKSLSGFLDEHEDDEIITSCICEAEISAGLFREKQENIIKKRELKEKIFSSFSDVIQFDSQQAEFFGKIYAQLASQEKMIDDMDILIAAAAMSNKAILVTKNPKHFQRIENLEILAI